MVVDMSQVRLHTQVASLSGLHLALGSSLLGIGSNSLIDGLKSKSVVQCIFNKLPLLVID